MSPTCERILEALRRAPGRTLTTSQLAQPDVGGTRFGGRIHELKKKHGYDIRGERIRDGAWSYTLHEPPVESSVRARDALAGAGEKTGSSVGAGLGGNAEAAVEVGVDPVPDADPGGTPFPPEASTRATDSDPGGVGLSPDAPGALSLFEVPPERLPHDREAA